MSNTSATDISNDSSFISANCLLALAVVINPYAVVARLLIIGFNFALFIVMGTLLRAYVQKHTIALHPNMKLLYANIVLSYAIGSISYSIAEFRHLYLMLFESSSSSPCAMLCPVWFALFSRSLLGLENTSLTLFHFVVMIERVRATSKAKGGYENEGIRFGMISIVIVYLLTIILLVIIGRIALEDMGGDLNGKLPFNSLVTKNTNPIVVFSLYISMGFIICTVVVDLVLIRKNRQMRRKATAIHRLSKCRLYYSLSENYQLHENILTMRIIIPLDIAYVLLNIFYCGASILNRYYQNDMPIFLANYNLISCPQLLYNIISMIYYKKFINLSDCSRKQMSPKIAQKEDMGQLYFNQLASQWDFS